MLQLTRVEDPRDNLEKATRDELFRFAQDRGVKEIDDRMFMGANAAVMMRKILRQKGMTNIQVRPHQLGMPPGVGDVQASPSASAETITAEEMAERDYAIQKSNEERIKQNLDGYIQVVDGMVKNVRPVLEMGIQELRSECKSRGIKMARTDNIKTLREKLAYGPHSS